MIPYLKLTDEYVTIYIGERSLRFVNGATAGWSYQMKHKYCMKIESYWDSHCTIGLF